MIALATERPGGPPGRTDRGAAVTVRLGLVLAALSATGALAGLLVGGGPGRAEVETARGALVTLYGDGLYAADTWLVGTGNRGQDVALLLVDIPILLAVLAWHRRASALSTAVLTGVVGFFTYFYVSMVFATAQNRLFPLYVLTAAVAGATLLATVARLDVRAVAGALPGRPGRGVLAGYLFAVAAALTLAWLPTMLGVALTGEVAEHVGPYTSSVTEALDLGLVVPLAVFAAVQLRRGTDLGEVLTLVMLVVNVCIGTLLMGQGVAQLLSDVPLTTAEIVAKMATFAALTLVAGGLLLRMATASRRPRRGAD